MARKTPKTAPWTYYSASSKNAKPVDDLVEQYAVIQGVSSFMYTYRGRPSLGLSFWLQGAHNEAEFRLLNRRSRERLLRQAAVSSEYDLVGKVVEILGSGTTVQLEDDYEYPLVTGKVVGLRLFPC
ncbi:hypothetical protein HYU22_03270 [Candidatus Woesearchaeota archaeon]|nr:hypothetical protein [Candidatus Woesearchaeota archaeon]